MPVTTINQPTYATARSNWIVGFLLSIAGKALHATSEPGPSNAMDSKPWGFERSYDMTINRLPADDLPIEWNYRTKWPPLYVKRKSSKSKRLLVYYHGGGFVNAMMTPQWNLIGLLARELDADIMIQTYVMVLHGSIHDNMDKLTFLYQKCRDIAKQEGQELIICGDSAGGAITASMLLACNERAIPLPDQAIMLAPAVYMNIFDNAEMRAIEPHDVILEIDRFLAALRAWAIGPITREQTLKPALAPTEEEIVKMSDPIASPLYGDWNFAAKAKIPVTLNVGTYDVVLPSVDAFVEKAKSVDMELTYIRANQACHVYPMLAGLPFANWLAPDSVEGLRLIVESVEQYSARS